jgi:predicted HTH domain antitoxin
LRNNGRKVVDDEPPPLFSKQFMEVIALAIKEGQISARKAADVLDLSIDDLADLLTTHGVEAAFEL